MYWYIKYPLIVIAVIAIVGIVGVSVRSCRSTASAPETVAVPPAAPAESGGAPVVPSDAETPETTAENAPAAAPAAPVVVNVENKLLMASQQLEKGMLEAARVLAWKVIDAEGVVEFGPEWEKAVAIINEADKRLMNSTAPASEKHGYRVVKGDRLEKIARRFYTNKLALQRINENLRRDGGDPIIRPSQTIMYISGVWSIRVSKQHFKLLLYLDGKLYRCWTIGIGRENRTPAGKFLITDAIAEPAWTPPGKNIPYGDPENVLGTRWLKLTPAEGTDPNLEGYGIHGTWEPESTGTSCSAGCVRMRNEDVEELFDFIPMPGHSTPPVQVLIEE